MQSYLARSLKKVGYGILTPISGLSGWLLIRDFRVWADHLWEPPLALLCLGIAIASFIALLKLRSPALFYSMQAKWHKRDERS